MTFWRKLLPALLLCPTFCPIATFAASKEIVELQRDLALLQEQVRGLQRSQDEKFSAIQVLVQQALDSANKTSTSVALLQNNLLQSFKDQQKSVVDPVVGVGAKLDQVTTDVSALRESVADISSQMGKLQQQMIDIGNAVRTIQTPAAAPPPAAIQPGPGVASAPSGNVPPVPAATLYQNANRDRNGGKDDLSLQEYADYLKYYGDSMLAPNAQYFIAEIHAKQNNLDQALAEFDMVLEKYPDNNKTPDALYMKGATLVKMGKRTQGKQEFCELVKRFPSNDLATRARSQVKALGLTCGPAAPVHRKKT
ncbi:MAG TPA: tetratricopeptide repeat protein [Bryobacteraceae bacterium]|nr:tetratricopeptide repeat protein [Bryobacteraceae bacterium]